MSKHITRSEFKKKNARGQLKFLRDYFRDTFKKIDRANPDFCGTFSSKNYDDLLAKSIFLEVKKVEGHFLDEQHSENADKSSFH